MENFTEIASGFINSGQYQEAIFYANKIIENNPGSSLAYEYRGLAQYSLLNIDAAFSDLSRAIELDNNNHKALASRSNLLKYRDQYDAAVADCESAIILAPENLVYKIYLSELYLIIKEYTKCIELADFVLNFWPDSYDALLYKADALCSLKRYNESIYFYKLLLNNFTHTDLLYNNIGFNQIYTNELQDAKKNFLAAIRLNPEWAYPWDNLGYVYYLEKNYDEAFKVINKSILLDPSNSWAYKNRALVYLSLLQRTEARADLLRAIELGYTRVYDNEVEEILNKEFNTL